MNKQTQKLFCEEYGHNWYSTEKFEISKYQCEDCGLTELEYLEQLQEVN